MKNTFKYMLAAVCAAPVLFSGCQSEAVPEGSQKVTVRIADVSGQTRTTYDNLEGKFAWSEGDEVALYLKNWGYETFALTVDSSDPAQASILSSSVGTHIRDGYAVYPATSAVNPATGSTALTVSFPAEYDLTALTGEEDFSPAILVAKNAPEEDLDFYHVGGLLRFMLTEIPSTVTKIVVTADKEIAGGFVVVTDDDDEPVPYVVTRTGENTDVSFTVSSSVIGSDGSLELNVPVPCGTYEWVKVEYFDATNTLLTTLQHASPLEIARHHGKRVAFVETEVELLVGDYSNPSAGVGKIKQPSGTPTVTNEGGLVVLSSAFVSYLVDGERVEEVPFIIQYSPNNRDWYNPGDEEYPDWLSAAPTVNLDGSTPDFPQELTIVIDPLKNQIPMTAKGVPMPAGSRTANLQAMSDAGMVDLSTVNVATGETVATSTANCYVVGAPGHYQFPAVYGNGLKNGAINEDAFRGKMKNATGDWVYRPDEGTSLYTYASALGRFLDHRDQLITSPYIAEQLGTSDFTAEVLWSDQPELIEQVHYEPNGTGAEDDYIWFEITHDGIAQGNALIGLLDGTGTIVWSWHIWVTDEDLTATTSLVGRDLNITDTKVYQMAPVALGWCNKVQIEQYDRITFYVRIMQDYVGGKASNSVKLTAGTTGSATRYGNAPYYMLGRKDPLLGLDGNKSFWGNKVAYPSRDVNPYYPQYALLEMITYGQSIQFPYKHYYPDTGVSRIYTKTYGNLWNSTQTTFTTSGGVWNYDIVTKTIYDPSPVGYKVPGPLTFYDIDFNRFKNGKIDAGQAPDGIVTYKIDDTYFVSTGYREKYFRNMNSEILMIATSHTAATSQASIGRYFHCVQGTQSIGYATINGALAVYPTVDE